MCACQRYGLTLSLLVGVFRQLEEEIDKMLSMDGLHRKDHVLELNRLMLRAESVEHRLSLLKIVQVTYFPLLTAASLIALFVEVSCAGCGL